jgi:hypothetical protein
MEAICIRKCTVPGLGLVESGRKVDIPEGPWEKHFDVPKTPKVRGRKTKEETGSDTPDADSQDT